MPIPRAGSRKPEPGPSSAIAGHATSRGTIRVKKRSADGRPSDYYRMLADEILVSSLGMGTYLGDCTDAEDARYVTVIAAGMQHGLNLVDTAINYRCQRSERAAGRAIRQAIDLGFVKRDEVVVSTKGGYIPLEGEPPASRELYERYLASEYFEREIMTSADVVSGGHSIAPAFLADQIRRSLDNMQLASIDIYYLHNPEQQLAVREPERFRVTLRQAFEELETQVAAGAIKAYGCATWNGFRVSHGSPGYLNLEEVVGLARDAGGESHHFRVVQMPINLAMTEGIRLPSQTVSGAHMPLLEAAAALGVSVIGSASLMQSQLTHGLPAELAAAFPSLDTDAQRAIAFVRSLPVSAALVGMRSLEHLAENLGAVAEVIPA